MPFSIYALVFANMLPLFGVLFLHWNFGAILGLYWFENLVIGIFNIFKMFLAQGGNYSSAQFRKYQFIPFFTMHYGTFTLVHGVFVSAFILSEISRLQTDIFQFTIQMSLGGASLFGSHLISYLTNYVGKKEYLMASADVLMLQPYARVVLIHVTLILGMFLTTALGTSAFITAIFVFLKIILDSRAHLKERLKFKNYAHAQI